VSLELLWPYLHVFYRLITGHQHSRKRNTEKGFCGVEDKNGATLSALTAKINIRETAGWFIRSRIILNTEISPAINSKV
jgi:hypothetical protein